MLIHVDYTHWQRVLLCGFCNTYIYCTKFAVWRKTAGGDVGEPQAGSAPTGAWPCVK